MKQVLTFHSKRSCKMYQLMFNPIKQQVNCIKKVEGNLVSIIPINEENKDYREYLEWLAEGNEPLPADDPS